MPLPEDLGPDDPNHIAHHNDLHAKANKAELGKVYNVLHYGAVGDGVANDTAAIANAIAAAPAGSVVYFPAGVYKTDAIVLTKMLHLLGDGRYSSWLKPNSAATSGLVQYNVPLPGATTRAVYGPTFRHLGIDLSAHATTVGISVASTTGWFVAQDFYVQGGAACVRNVGTNSRYERFRMVDAFKFFEIDGNTGMELTLKDGDCTRSSSGTTSVGIEIIGTLSSGNGGDLRIDNVTLNSTNTGGAVFQSGLLIQQNGNVSIPVFADQFIVDNCAGPSVTLTNIKDARFDKCWFNSAAGTTCAVKITAGGNLRFTDSDFFGGSGGSAGTFEFLGATATAGFTSRGNYCPSGPVYRFTGSGGVTDMVTDDIVPGATAVSQVTNDEAKFLAGAARRWGKVRLQQVPETPAEAAHVVGSGGSEPPFTNSWVAAVGTIVYFIKDPSGTVFLGGLMNGGATGTSAFTLPAGYRPALNSEFFETHGGQVEITTAGLVKLTGTTVSISGISFRGV